MRSSVAITNIKNKLAEVLPAVLTAEGLEDFDEYVAGDPTSTGVKSLAVYFNESSNDTDLEVVSFLIQLQLYRVLSAATATLYKDVVGETILKYVQPSLAGMTMRSQVKADQFPVQEDVGTAFVFFDIVFSRDLDDCDD